MSTFRLLSRELKNIDKRRTLSLLGFLFILAFFPVIFSSPNDTQNVNINAAQLDNQAIPPANSLKTQQASIPAMQQQPNQTAQQLPSPAQTGSFLANKDDVYSPQPSIWLFLLPIALTFFTILFY